MLTESGTVLASVTVNQAMQRKLTKKLYIASIICLVIGVLGLAAYLVIAVVLEKNESDYLDVMLLFAVPFGFGLIFLLSLQKKYRDAVRAGERVMTYEFFADGLVIREFSEGKQLAMSRADYSQMVKVAEKSEYIFIYFIKTALLPVDKATLTGEELAVVRGLIGLAPADETAKSALPKMSENDK